MNIRKLFLISIILIIVNIGYSANQRLCQKGVFVFFGNGVWNDEKESSKSKDLLI